MPLPNLIVIGAQKCGTTSLHHYLGLHPEIAMASGPDSNEVHFFSWENRWRLGLDWYAGRFTDAPVRGEVSPSYSEWPFRPWVPERIRDLLPDDVRFVYLVRDPIERLRSGWTYARAGGHEPRPFADALARLEDNRHVARSCYATQLERYLALFPQERFLVLDQHDLKHARDEALRRTFRFLGVDDRFVTPRFETELNVSEDARWLTPSGRRVVRVLHRTLGRRVTHAVATRVPARLPGLEQRSDPLPVVEGELRGRLVEQLAPEAARLRELTGEPFAGWSV